MKRLWFGLLFLLLAACAKPPQPVWTELPSATELLQRLQQASGQTVSLDAAASVGLRLNGKYISSQQFLLLERPDRLRADVLTGFGQLVLQLTSDGEQLAVFDNTTVPGHYYRGVASDQNVSRFTRIPLATRELLRLLLYDPPLIGYQQSQVVLREEGLLLRLTGAALEQELLFDPQLRLSGCRYLQQGERFLEVLYQKIDARNSFPAVLRIEAPRENTQVVFKLSEVVLNREIPAEKFRLKAPVKLPVEPLPGTAK